MIPGVLSVQTQAGAGLLGRSRSRRDGPEADLVDQFVSRFQPDVPKGCECVVLKEPRIDSGFPDIVMLVWDSNAAAQWPSARREVDRADLRLAHLILTLRSACEDRLSAFTRSRLCARLSRLERARLIHRAGGEWRMVPIQEAFAVRQILAFEAKMTLTSQVIDQAAANRWFASASYVLLPSWNSRSALVDEADDCGIGIWINGSNVPTLRQRSVEQPLSYASWLFNDWAWRVLARRSS